MTMPDHNERCRQLAELRVTDQDSAWSEPINVGGLQGSHGGASLAVGYDPRFAALRGKHDMEMVSLSLQRCKMCGESGYHYTDERRKGEYPYCLRTGADALLECAAACGYVLFVGKDHTWFCRIGIPDEVLFEPKFEGEGSTPAVALSAALWQAEVGAR